MRYFISVLLVLFCPAAAAVDVALIGVIGDKAAVLAVNGGEPKTVKVGQKWSGIGVVAVEKDRATIEVDGKRRVLMHGQHYRSAPQASSRESATLAADSRGHFFTEGAVNGGQQRFLVDTGASAVVLSASDAKRLALDYLKGAKARVHTAGGVVGAYRLRLDQVRVGGIELHNVDAVVIEEGLGGAALLGMSFLNRVEMKREGETMTLIRRF
jgi:aspartyl protease family protein